MKKIIEDIRNDNYKNIDDIIYSYEQGLEMGKDEMKIELLNKAFESNLETDVISKIFNIKITEIKSLKKQA